MVASREFILSIINKVNPLWLPTSDGKGHVFGSYVDCYIYFMDKCHEVAPKGYMDLYILIVELYGWRFSKAVGFYKTWLGERMGERITLINVDDLKTKAYYRKFITAMHEYFDTPFDLQAFAKAWDIHKQHVLSKQLNLTDYAGKQENQAKGNKKQ